MHLKAQRGASEWALIRKKNSQSPKSWVDRAHATGNFFPPKCGLKVLRDRHKSWSLKKISTCPIWLPAACREECGSFGSQLSTLYQLCRGVLGPWLKSTRSSSAPLVGADEHELWLVNDHCDWRPRPQTSPSHCEGYWLCGPSFYCCAPQITWGTVKKDIRIWLLGRRRMKENFER